MCNIGKTAPKSLVRKLWRLFEKQLRKFFQINPPLCPHMGALALKISVGVGAQVKFLPQTFHLAVKRIYLPYSYPVQRRILFHLGFLLKIYIAINIIVLKLLLDRYGWRKQAHRIRWACFLVGVAGLGPAKEYPADLQSAAIAAMRRPGLDGRRSAK